MTRKYHWNPAKDDYIRGHYDGRIPGRTGQIAKTMGRPKAVIMRRAKFLGLTHTRDHRRFTPEEQDMISLNADHRCIQWIATRLQRSTSSIRRYLQRRKIRHHAKGGYTLSDLSFCFGVDHRTIHKWFDAGLLRHRRRGTDHPAKPWHVTEADLLTFVKKHPMVFRLDRVDQVWFMDLVAGGDLMKKWISIDGSGE